MGRMLRRALHDAGNDPWVVELGVERRDRASRLVQARFAARVLFGHLLQKADWVLYNHLSVARAHHAIPPALRLPYGVFAHDVEAWSADLTPSRSSTLTDAAVVIANSRHTASRITAAHPYLQRVQACPLGLMQEHPHTGAPDRALLEAVSAHAVLIVGRVTSDERYKGHDQLLDAWPMVVAACPRAQLLVAGWGDDIPRLQEKAAALGIAQAVLFCGYVAEATLAALYQRVALYAMPSAREGFGLVYLEAMRAGVPCLGSTLDAAGDIIVDGETGYLVDRDDAVALAGAILSVLNDPGRRVAMGEAGRRRFKRDFTYERFRERLYAILSGAFPGFDTQSLRQPAIAAQRG